MLQKEDARRLGWALIILSFAILIGNLANNFGSITGFATYNRGTLTSEFLDVYVGDEIVYTGACSEGGACDNANCNGVVVGSTLTIPATAVDGSCICTVSTTASGCITPAIITLNIKTTQTASTNNLVASTDVGISVAYSIPRNGLDSEETG